MQDPGQHTRLVFEVSHIQSGDHLRAESLDEVCAWMMKACQNLQLRAGASPGDTPGGDQE
jgi:hypothetical protein